MTKDHFVFYVCVLAAVVAFFANQARACTTDQKALQSIEKRLTSRIYNLAVKNGAEAYTDIQVESLWSDSARKAHRITMDNFLCPEYDLLKASVLFDLKEKQRKY